MAPGLSPPNNSVRADSSSYSLTVAAAMTDFSPCSMNDPLMRTSARSYFGAGLPFCTDKQPPQHLVIKSLIAQIE